LNSLKPFYIVEKHFNFPLLKKVEQNKKIPFLSTFKKSGAKQKYLSYPLLKKWGKTKDTFLIYF